MLKSCHLALDQYAWRSGPTSPASLLVVWGGDNADSQIPIESIPYWSLIAQHLSTDPDTAAIWSELRVTRDRLAKLKSEQDQADESELAHAIEVEYGSGFTPWASFLHPDQDHAFNAPVTIGLLRSDATEVHFATVQEGRRWVVESGTQPFLLTREEGQASPGRFLQVYRALRLGSKMRQRQLRVDQAFVQASQSVIAFQAKMQTAADRLLATGRLSGHCSDCPPA